MTHSFPSLKNSSTIGIQSDVLLLPQNSLESVCSLLPSLLSTTVGTRKIQLSIISLGRNFKIFLQILWHLSHQTAMPNISLPSGVWTRFSYLHLMKKYGESDTMWLLRLGPRKDDFHLVSIICLSTHILSFPLSVSLPIPPSPTSSLPYPSLSISFFLSLPLLTHCSLWGKPSALWWGYSRSLLRDPHGEIEFSYNSKHHLPATCMSHLRSLSSSPSQAFMWLWS